MTPPGRTQPSFVDPRVHAYLQDRIQGETEVMRDVRETCEAQGLPAIAPESGRMLQVLAGAMDARRVLEVGLLHGYSALWLANASRRVRVETVEIDPEMARTASRNFSRAGVTDRIRIHEGDATRILPDLEGPYDLILLDADKENLPRYLEESARLLRPGGTLAVDNVLWSGRVLDPDAEDAATRAVREFTDTLLGDARFMTTMLPVGDGLSISILRE